MVQLVLTFCLALSGSTCKTVRPPFEQGYASLMRCMTAAQFIAADMLRDRLDLQGYRLTRWRCGPGGPPGTAT
ncbi:MAG: hypothetical protein M0002_05610 [Rhodospirillales bacterium]|nr:hypothetical protein [Rhodospirillales bacterium]